MRVFVLTSDKYLQCLPPFAHLFNKFWGDNQEVIFVGFERPVMTFPRNFRFWSLGKMEAYTWSEAALKLCRMISDPIICLFLEDYFLDRAVNQNAVYNLYNLMMDNPSIYKVDLTDDRLKVPHSTYPSYRDMELIRADDDSPYQASLQAAFWRKEFFYQTLKGNENPWQFEKAGTKRIVKWHETEQFDILGCKVPPVTYINAVGGEGNHPHLWAYKRFPGWMVKDLQNRGYMPIPEAK